MCSEKRERERERLCVCVRLDRKKKFYQFTPPRPPQQKRGHAYMQKYTAIPLLSSSEAELQLMGMNFCNRRTADKVRKAAKLTGNKQLMDQVLAPR